MIRLPHFCLRSSELSAQVAPLSALVIVNLWFTSFGCKKMGQRIVVTIMSFFCFLNPKPKDREAVLMFGFGRLHLILPWVPKTDIDSHKLLKQRWNDWGNVQYLLYPGHVQVHWVRVYLNFWVYLKHQVIPNISGYLISDNFKNWIRSSQVLKKCWVTDEYRVSGWGGPWLVTYIRC